MPFTVEQFLQVFTEYNLAIWPAQIVLWAAGAVVAILLFFHTRPMARLATGILGALWLWCAVVYHWMHFSAVNPAAWLFGGLFVVAAFLLIRTGHTIDIDEERPLRIAAGGAFVVYALLIYPAAGYLTGHVYPELPTFGAPCPLAIFTLGILIAARPPVRWSAASIPLIWAVIASWAALKFGMTEDFGLIFAAIAFIVAAASEHVHHQHRHAPLAA